MSFIILIYFIFLISKFITCSLIKIPFIVENYNKVKNPQIIDKYLYKDIIVKLYAGTPEQEVQLSACLGEYTTFIISKDAEGYDYGIYNKNKSNTFKVLENENPEFYIFQTFSEGIKSKDNIRIKNYDKIDNYEFVLATEFGMNNCYSLYCETLNQPGILGFLISQNPNQMQENVTNTNFISQLKKRSLISDYFFTFHFNSENSGNIIIGMRPDDYDNKTYKEDDYFPIKTSIGGRDYLDWSIEFDEIIYGNITMKYNEPILLRIEYGLINGFYEWNDYLKSEFFDELIEKKKCFMDYTSNIVYASSTKYYYCNKDVDLNKFKPFVFSLHQYDYNFTFTKDDLFIKVGDKYLFLIVFNSMPGIFGYPFFKKYQPVFNQDTKTIGFYRYIKNIPKSSSSSNSNTAYYIAIIILGILLIALIIFVIIFYIKGFRKPKKNANELTNENSQYEYDDMNKKSLVDDENNVN